MTLVAETEPGKPVELMRLARDGELSGAISGGPASTMKLDPAGCVTIDGEVMLELEPSAIWTLRHRVRSEGARMWPAEHWVAIDADGWVTDSRWPDDERLRLDGYEPAGSCAGKMMILAMVASAPSMAVSDGGAVEVPRDPKGACAASPSP